MFTTKREIIARFNSRCPKCQGFINTGEKVLWEQGAKAEHVNCQPAVVVPTVNQKSQFISVDEIGVYVLPDGTVVKVQPNQDKTRTYAKRWVQNGNIDRLTDGHEIVHGDYVFEAGLVSTVAEIGRKMTADEAHAFCLRYGQCVRCARKLKDAKSVKAAMGPRCRKYFGLA
jgi:hypothetical protein